MYVFPVLAVKQVREDEEDRHKDQNENPQALTLYFYRITHVGHEVGQVPHGLVELGTRHAAFDRILRTHITVVDVAAEGLYRGTYANVRLDGTQTLKVNHHVGHAHQVEHSVVDAQRTGIVLVETTQVGVNPRLTTHTGFQRQVWWRSTEPASGHALVHGVFHQLTDLCAGENEVLLEQLGRDLQVVRYTLVAGVFHGVATHAVVGEQCRTTLQGFLVGMIRLHRVKRNRDTSCQADGRQDGENETKNKLSHHPVTLSGTGLVFSMRV